MRKALAAVALLAAGFLAATALPAGASSCPADTYAHGMAKARAAYFAKHSSKKQRAAFVKAQKAKLAKLRASPACAATTPTSTDTGTVAAPPPAPNEHFVFSDELPQAARDEIEQDVAYAVQDENAILGTQFGDVTIFASTDTSWLGQHECDFTGHSDSGCYDQTSARFAGGRDAGEGYTGGLSLNWHQGDLSASTTSEIQKVIAHELFHSLQFQLDQLGDRDGSTPPDQVKPSGPVWLLEGAAEMVGYHVAGDRRMLSYSSTIAGALNGWRLVPPKLDQTLTLNDSNNRGAPYQLYMLAADRLASVAPGGLHAVAAYYTSLASGLAWPDAFAQAFGLSVDDFYANFAAYLKSAG